MCTCSVQLGLACHYVGLVERLLVSCVVLLVSCVGG